MSMRHFLLSPGYYWLGIGSRVLRSSSSFQEKIQISESVKNSPIGHTLPCALLVDLRQVRPIGLWAQEPPLRTVNNPTNIRVAL